MTTSEEVVVSMFVTVMIIYFSKFINPSTGIDHIDALISHIKKNDQYMGYAAIFSAIVAILSSLFMVQLSIEYAPHP
jgi:hypothetical protein